MGVLLDSTFLISAERRRLSASEALEEVNVLLHGEDCALSVISVMELAHGAARADSQHRTEERDLFLERLMTALDTYQVTPQIALRAGRLDGQLKKVGIQIAISDLLIGVTALELGFGVFTKNVRHFEQIPDLRVIRQIV